MTRQRQGRSLRVKVGVAIYCVFVTHMGLWLWTVSPLNIYRLSLGVLL